MNLTKIKISGFKSFVDPTIVNLPSNLVAVVGPNGSGKSNIIDAVCWVMGENSAKYLRGESLSDVIFNGSSARKPVGQASVELIFDNQDGTLGGEYASYAEISIRRVISREGDSTYYLNGARCRRKDIIDIFLGTGLGPRSYSIIGQNMISRIIEAKPDDMRIYLEEAAGISKYKERRRETENRIHHTKDNLARLNDIRSELEKQLGTLKRQANAAEKYKTLKQEERLMRSQWQAIQWRQLDDELIQHSVRIQQQETVLESKQADLTDNAKSIEKIREDIHFTNEQFQEVQKQFYTVGNDINRIEQEKRYQEEQRRQWGLDLATSQKEMTAADEQLTISEKEKNILTEELAELDPLVKVAIDGSVSAITQLEKVESEMQNWQVQWDEYNVKSSRYSKTAEVQQTRIQHLEQQLAHTKQRHQTFERDQSQFNVSHLEEELNALEKNVSEFSQTTENYEQKLTSIREKIYSLQTSEDETNDQLDLVRNEIQQLRGQQSSLEALQQTALGQKNNSLNQWLAKHGLEKNSRLAQNIEVEAGWEKALEVALGPYLQAICVDTLSSVTDSIQDFKNGQLCLVATSKKEGTKPTSAQTLLNKVSSSYDLTAMLGGIFVAENEVEALKVATSLEPHESVITRDGIWVNATWLRISHDESPAAGIFMREQELKSIVKQISHLTEKHHTLEAKLDQIREQIQTFEDEREEVQLKFNQAHAKNAELKAEQKTKLEKISDLKKRAERFHKEQQDNQLLLERTQADLTEAKKLWQEALNELSTLTTQHDQLDKQRDQLKEVLHESRNTANRSKDDAHQLELRLQTKNSELVSINNAIARLRTQLDTVTVKRNTLQKELENAPKLEELEKTLTFSLGQRLKIEEELNIVRHKLQTQESEVQQFEAQRQKIDASIVEARNILENCRLDWREIKVRSENLAIQISESGFVLEDVLKELPEEVSAEEWQSQVMQIGERIKRLGAINLVAIEEYATCAERKDYLDKQYLDLQEGLTTLESAIDKIDKETRTRFKETFEKVNTNFKELFPKIFGGGTACLELTGDNLLDTGITVMACPPGKRNSTIHLLSGGEKAMTAISLIFSIFQLNPAPFCLLDEVDAPLDDANIQRYCDLVKSMSEKTQFVFISHNKLAIEMAKHLMGVTMHEPGVSRLVSVDIQEAVNLAGA